VSFFRISVETNPTTAKLRLNHARRANLAFSNPTSFFNFKNIKNISVFTLQSSTGSLHIWIMEEPRESERKRVKYHTRMK
jgi:hypothetical protein